MEAQQPAAKSNKTWIIVVGAVALVLAVCVIVPICLTLLLAMLGPAVGSVFSNIIATIAPTP